MKKIKDQPADSAPTASVLAREELEKKLQFLAKAKSPQQLSPGAMCYSMAAPPDRFEYVCPVCHGKTIYECGNIDSFTIHKIDYYRRMVKQLNDNGLDCKIDESSFCHKCGKGAKKRKLILETKWAGEDIPYRAVLDEPDDLGLVLDFITGKDRHTDAFGTEYSLKKSLMHISRIIGISAGDKIEKAFLNKHLARIKKSAFNIIDIPDIQLSYELCLAAVEQSGLAIGFVPEELRTRELCLVAIKKDGFLVLKDVPEAILDRELCLVAIKKEAFALTRIPEKFKTREFYLAAVKLNKEALQYVPKEFIDSEFYPVTIKF